MNLKERILNEMLETKEDKIVRELKDCPGFDEHFIRKRFKELSTSFHSKEK